MFFNKIALAGLASVASAHILMTNPVPYGKDSLTNGPLLADGSDFPCKQRAGVYNDEGASNVYKQGSKQQLSFQGTAVHGGGSCQVSVTKDLKPTKNSIWKVIKSIEGGCPAEGQTGNMGDSASSPVPYKYNFDIPQDLSAGNYTLAWTWFNKVGNREMYMNCAPMTVEGSGGSDSFMSALPDMFVANVGNGCSTKDSTDVQFPDPGKAVEKLNGATNAFAPPAGTCAKPTGSSGGSDSSGSNGASAPPPTSAPVASPTSAPAAGSSSPSSSIPGGVFVTVPTQAASAPVVSPVASTSAPAASSAPTPTAAPESGSGGNGTGTGSSPSGGYASGTACTSEGEWNCIGGKSFQRCASGSWSAVQAMAAGVSCTAGQSAELKMNARSNKLALRRALRDLLAE